MWKPQQSPTLFNYWNTMIFFFPSQQNSCTNRNITQMDKLTPQANTFLALMLIL